MTKKPKVTLVTSANMPELFSDESGLPDALAERGMDPQIAVWNDPTVDWDAAGVCVIRSVSDYASNLLTGQIQCRVCSTMRMSWSGTLTSTT